MLCYVMLCCVVLCYVMLCCVMLCCVVLCCLVLCSVVLCCTGCVVLCWLCCEYDCENVKSCVIAWVCSTGQVWLVPGAGACKGPTKAPIRYYSPFTCPPPPSPAPPPCPRHPVRLYKWSLYSEAAACSGHTAPPPELQTNLREVCFSQSRALRIHANQPNHPPIWSLRLWTNS